VLFAARPLHKGNGQEWMSAVGSRRGGIAGRFGRASLMNGVDGVSFDLVWLSFSCLLVCDLALFVSHSMLYERGSEILQFLERK